MTRTLSALSSAEVRQQLRSEGLALHTPPFSCRIHSNIESVSAGLQLLYGDYPLCEESDYCDFHITLKRPSSLRRWIRPQVIFDFDGRQPFYPLPVTQAFPMFEWGLNWCVSNHINTYLILHSAVVAHNDKAILLPGEPGAGKSTLCAALINSGFRLLSDELTLIDDGGTKAMPIPRPVSLKNASINVIGQRFPDCTMSPAAHDTVKGSVAHMKVPGDSLECAHTAVEIACVVFPRYQQESPLSLKTVDKGTSMMRLVEQSFNYHILGQQGYDWLCQTIGQSECYEFVYSDLDDAINTFRQLSAGH